MLPSEWKQWFAIKLLVIAALLVAVLCSPPYGYYQILRVGLMLFFFKLGMKEYENGRFILTGLCCMAALLFQPVIKLAFNKYEWSVIDQWTILLMSIWCVVDVRNYRLGNY